MGVIQRVLEAASTLPSSSTCTEAFVPSIFSVTIVSRFSLAILAKGSKAGVSDIIVPFHSRIETYLRRQYEQHIASKMREMVQAAFIVVRFS